MKQFNFISPIYRGAWAVKLMLQFQYLRRVMYFETRNANMSYMITQDIY